MEPPRTRGHRTEADAPASLAAGIRARTRSDWPVVTKEQTVDGLPSVELYRSHDRPHDSAKIEWWYINGHFGENKRYSVFAAFFRLASNDGTDRATHIHAANWALIDSVSQTYRTFSELDERSPSILLEMIENNEYHGDPHVLQALKEMCRRGEVLHPDALMSSDVHVSSRSEPLKLVFGKNKFENVRCSDGCCPNYALELKGNDAIGDVHLRLEIQPVCGAALHGKHGVVSTGHSEEDMFYYFSPICSLQSGSMTRGGEQAIPLSNGTFWIDHEFGGTTATSEDERKYLHSMLLEHTNGIEHSWEWAALHLDDGDALSVTILRDMNQGGRVVDLFAIHQDRATGRFSRQDGEQLVFQSDPQKRWKSSATGMSFPTQWTVVVPSTAKGTYTLTLSATMNNQEFVTLAGKPSYWEGRVDVKGSLKSNDGHARDVTGVGFMECHGEKDLHEVSKAFDLLHAMLLLPREVSAPPAFTASATELSQGEIAAAVEMTAMMVQMTTNEHMPEQHKTLLRALLATYSLLYHHGEKDLARAASHCSWLQSVWETSLKETPMDFKTLVLRAFTLRSLDRVIGSKCPGLRSGISGADVPTAGTPQGVTASSAPQPASCAAPLPQWTVPSVSLFDHPATSATLRSIASLFEGTWDLDREKKVSPMTLSEFLAAQGVGIAARMLVSSVTPRLSTKVDCDLLTIASDVITTFGTSQIVIWLDGKGHAWDSFGRGTITTTACIQSITPSEVVLALRTPVANGDIEIKWLRVSSDGTMEERMRLFPGSEGFQGPPKAEFIQFFKRVTTN